MLHIDDQHRLVYCSDNIQGKCVIPDDVVEIKSSAFQRCSSLQEIIIPKSVKKIGERAFADCPSLEKITVEEGNPTYDSRSECNAIVETVTNTIIAGCKNTRIPESIQHIHPDAFEGTRALIPIQNVVIELMDNKVFLKELFIPEEIEEIKIYPDDMFLELLPESILYQTEKFDYQAISSFDYQAISSLEKISVSPNNKIYDSRENCNAIIETASNKLLFGCATTSIPNNVIEIDDNAFSECSTLEEVIIPNGVTRIGACSFCACSSLQRIVLPSSLNEIDEFAFIDCKNLSEINIPNSVTIIGEGAFEGCEKLSEIRLPDSVKVIGEAQISDGVFYRCKALKRIYIPKGQKQRFIEMGLDEYKDLLCEE